MARKGSSKVKTGCITCKVKCDEGKPHCNRCTSTRRRCDGYAAPKSDSWLLCRRPRHLSRGAAGAAESRALQYFCEIAGPFLPGPSDPYFWTQLVMQFSSFEPVVRYSVIAISSLYEECQTEAPSGTSIGDNTLALRYYNAAIAELKVMQNPSLVLLVCILFICIESLQSNREVAIRHCNHGIAIMESDVTAAAWAKEHLKPVFRRLSVFPYMFGSGNEEFPSPVALDDPIPVSFSTFSEARAMMDDIFSRAVRLVRYGSPYRLGHLRYADVPIGLLEEQEKLNYRLDLWQTLFTDLDTRLTPQNMPATQRSDLGEEYIKLALRLHLSISCEISRISSNMAFSVDETSYDAYLCGFRRVIEQFTRFGAITLDKARTAKGCPKFIFETGFTPMLFCVATKCRDLSIRLTALSLMKLLGVHRENLWEADTAYAVARRVIEIEHVVILNELGQPLGPPLYPGLPPDRMRVRKAWTEFEESIYADKFGQEMSGKVVTFYMRTPEDTIYHRTEFLATGGSDKAPENSSPLNRTR
ncbi:hypothetical protein DL764_002033 [Monosporascus ibericus]|uniref:Zn(2)-C6 fungal-type domain-containing protein n=1 Tax=Monosporascus ibericus TaxID=155417 RepID=A0A4Q4TNE5_9PEZI|nr:hypothetical protein DL764_002033 [Monosporascus ibericus]